MIDYRGARGSNTGDDFHELWAVRHALTLLDQETDLSFLTVEGLLPDDEVGTAAATWDGVDCALYYGGSSVAKCKKIVIEQVKYSGSQPNTEWTLARLTRSKAKTTNNSVLRRLASAYEGIRLARDGEQEGIEVRLISNQPVDLQTLEILQNIKESGAKSQDEIDAIAAIGLSGEALIGFLGSLDLQSQTGSRFTIEAEILKTISNWADDDGRAPLAEMSDLVRKLMMPEGKGKKITREDVLVRLGFSSGRVLFPCPNEITRPPAPVPRAIASTVVEDMKNGCQFINLHGGAGCGKTTVLQEIELLLPPNSTMITFDCYGGGRYLDSDAYRHRPQDAFRQLANDLSTRLRVPLLLSRAADHDYARSFQRRVNLAADAIAAKSVESLLVLVADAADNSITAARGLVPPERSFVSEFATLGDLRKNVRILITARTGRLAELQLPSRFKSVELAGFTVEETRLHVEKTWKHLPVRWITEFHELSHHNPRVQGYAIAYATKFGQGKPEAALDCLRPQGKLLEDIFNQQFAEALRKNGSQSAMEVLCAALIALPRPIPWPDLSAITQLSVDQLRDICFDLAPAIRIADDGLGFADEDFEQFVRARTQAVETVVARVAEWFLYRHQTDPYAATHVAAALHHAGRAHEIIQILENEHEPSIIADPFLKRDVQLQRMRIAVTASVELNDTVNVLKTILVGAEALKTQAAIRDLAVSNPDLSVAFMRDSASKMVLFDPKQIEHHGPFLFHLLREEILERKGISARDTARQLTAWLTRRQQMMDEAKKENPRSSTSQWKIEDYDVAADIEAALISSGPHAAMEAISDWHPKELAVRVARILIPRLLTDGKASLVREFIDLDLIRKPWTLAFLVPLSISGQSVDLAKIESALKLVSRAKLVSADRLEDLWRNNDAAYWFDTILTACEITFARGGDVTCCLPVLTAFTDEGLRREDSSLLFDSSLTSLTLRAHALLQINAGQAVTVDSFLVKVEKHNEKTEGMPSSRSSSDSERIERSRELIRCLVPIYSVRAEILSGQIPIHEVGARLSATLDSFRNNSWRLSREAGSHDTRKAVARSIASLVFVPNIDLTGVLARSLEVFGDQRAEDGSDEVSTLSVLAPNSTLHGDILDAVNVRAKAVRALKVPVRQKASYLLQIVRFLRPISQPDARVLFAQALAMTEELDVDAKNKLRCIGKIAVRARDVASREARRSTANDLFAISTDAAIRLDDEAFPWSEVVEALTALDFGVALAATARWEDDGVVDRESCLSALLGRAIRDHEITSEEATAFFPLLDRPDIELLRTIVKNLGPGGTNDVTEVIAKHELLRFGRGTRADVLLLLDQIAPEGFESGDSWFGHLKRTVEFRQVLARPEDGSAAMETDKEVDPSTIESIIRSVFAQHPEISEIDKSLKLAIEESRKAERFIHYATIVEHFRAAIRPNDRILFLDSLTQLSTELISDNELADSIFQTVQAWSSPAVMNWCEAQIPKFVVNHFTALSVWLSFEKNPPLIRLLSLLPTPVLRRTLVDGIVSHLNELTAATLYDSLAVFADNLEPDEASRLLQQYLPRVVRSVPEPDFRPFLITDIPVEKSLAIARYLYVQLSDCDVRIRWRTAHVARLFGKFGLDVLLLALADLYGRSADKSFRSPDAPLHWLNARLWMMIAFAKITEETPNSLRNCANRILTVALDESFPHVLVRKFAKDAVLALAKQKILNLTPSQKKDLGRIESGHLKRKRARNGLSTPQHVNRGKERRFHFDVIDTIPYWYEPAAEVFADVSVDEFTDVAERWIVDRWTASNLSRVWKDQPRRHRYLEYQWALWSHGHGSTPTIERYDTYLEWHAMWCAFGELLQHRPVAAVNADEYGSLEYRLNSDCLSLPPNWLFDFRGPKPLEKQFFDLQISDEWIASIEDHEFLAVLGISVATADWLVIRGEYETTSSEGSCKTSIDAALVQPDTAIHLVRALQTVVEPIDFALPSDDDKDSEQRFQIDKRPYRLIGCIARLSGFSGIDEKDPLRNTISETLWRPGRRLGEKFRKQISLEAVAQPDTSS